jgi:three-Cys-motif partner protein
VESRQPRFDHIGYWSELKLDIIREYASAYTRIISAQREPSFHSACVDAFAGAGVHVSRRTGQMVKGSPLVALDVNPPFDEYHFVDLDGSKVAYLREQVSGRGDVTVHEGDSNRILLREILPRCEYRRYCRALWLLDPYGLDLDWSVVQGAGEARSIEIFLNFPVMDMNRNVLWRDQARVAEGDVARMNAFWGDESWRQAAYSSQPTLFGTSEDVKLGNIAIARAYCDRLRTRAGFAHVSEPLPMRNRSRAVVYYLIFASQKPVAEKIVHDIFDKYRNRGAG